MKPRKDGLVHSGSRLVFRCECGREQAHAPPGRSGGITIPEAKSVGWTATYAEDRSIMKWTCPFCGGSATADQPAWSSEDLQPVDLDEEPPRRDLGGAG